MEWPSELPFYYSWCHQNAFRSIFPLSSGTEKKSLGARSGEKAGCSNTVICLVAKLFAAVIQAPTFSRRHTKTHANSNRCHSERRCHRSATTQLWNADMSTSSNHTKAFVQRCHGEHTVASSRTCPTTYILRNLLIRRRWNIILEIIYQKPLIPNFITIRPAGSALIHADRQPGMN